MPIESTLLYQSQYVPQGANSVNLYKTAFTDNLTLGQLMAAVCIRAGSMLEDQSVAKMNELIQDHNNINKLSDILERMALNNIPASEWSSVRSELYRFDISADSDALDSYQKRLAVMASIKNVLERRTQQSQEDMIDLQNLINRRDVTFSTATNLVRSTGQTKSNTAGNLR